MDIVTMSSDEDAPWPQHCVPEILPVGNEVRANVGPGPRATERKQTLARSGASVGRCIGKRRLQGGGRAPEKGTGAPMQRPPTRCRELPQRCDDEMKSLLASLDPPHIVYESSTHGVNNCLIDSIILSLTSLGVALSQTLPQRAAICTDARQRLMEQHSVGALDYLSHEDHFDIICMHLRSLGTQFWHLGHDPTTRP